MAKGKDISMTIIWGTGYIYKKYRDFLRSEYPDACIGDRKFTDGDSEYDGYTVRSPYTVDRKEDCRIVICMTDQNEMEKIESSPELSGCHFVRLTGMIPIERRLTTEEIREKMDADGVYRDCYGNVIACGSPDLLDRASFRFNGENAHVRIGRNCRIYDNLETECGNDCSIIIGDDSTIHNAVIYSAYADVTIGRDCMLSYGVFIRNHDSHFIFDKVTGKRINYSRSINIGDHVWVGQRSTLLSGFGIGDGSIVGAGSVSSSSFGENLVIAGCPAKVIRNDVCWDRTMTWCCNYDTISEMETDR